MAKAINWPIDFYDEILNEDSTSPRIALRIGTIYFDNDYYVPNEIVDIRINHKIERKAIITDNLKLFKIKDLNEEIIKKYKKNLQDKSKIIEFLSSNYNQEITEETPVTVIIYQNLPIEEFDGIDDPHHT